MRGILTLLHRYAGLFIAGFLFISGLTGAVISWDHELDDILNPGLMQAATPGTPQSSLALAEQVAARHPHAAVTFLPLAREPGKSLSFGVEPRIDPATGKPYDLGFNEVFVDPVSGRELGAREWGAAWPLNRTNFVSFLYVLHYSLHIPAMWGIDRWGLWLMGFVAVIWMLDSFVGFVLTLPVKRKPGAPKENARGWLSRWAPAWKIKTSTSLFRINFDLHRAFGLWTWGLLFVLAFTAFSLNLYREAFYPILSTVSQVTPSPFDLRTPAPLDKPITAEKSFGDILAAAQSERARRGWAPPPGSIFYSRPFGIYGVAFFNPGDDHGAAGVGPPQIYFDGKSGKLLGDLQPWKGTLADIFVQAQFPLHSGRILGLPGRILISLMGLVVAALSATGIVIWAKKRRSRLVGRKRAAPQARPACPRPEPAE